LKLEEGPKDCWAALEGCASGDMSVGGAAITPMLSTVSKSTQEAKATEWNPPPGNIGLRLGLGFATDPLLLRAGAPVVPAAPGLAPLLPFPDLLAPAPALPSCPSLLIECGFDGTNPVVSLRRFIMLAGVTGAMFGLTEVDPDALMVVEEDAEETELVGFVAGGAGGGIERSTGEGVSFDVRNGVGPVPRVAGVDVDEEVDEFEGPLRLGCETEG